MDEIEDLKSFRADVSAPGAEQVASMRADLDQAIEEERSTTSARGARGRPRRLPLALAGAAAVLVAAALAVVALPGSNDTSEVTPDPSLRAVSAELQSYTHLDFDHLADLGLTLEDIAAQAEVVGVGRIVDIRLGYEEADGLRHMFLVIEPDRLASGAEQLGASGEVLLDQPAPPVDRQTDSRGIDELRELVVGAPERVAFMLSPTPASTYAKSPNELAGRAEDDPVYRPAHPSSVLVVDEEGRVAFPLVTDEKLEDSPGNVEALAELGAQVDRFTAGVGAAGGTQY